MQSLTNYPPPTADPVLQWAADPGTDPVGAHLADPPPAPQCYFNHWSDGEMLASRADLGG